MGRGRMGTLPRDTFEEDYHVNWKNFYYGCAKDLGYDEQCFNDIQNATTYIQVERALKDGRHRWEKAHGLR